MRNKLFEQQPYPKINMSEY